MAKHISPDTLTKFGSLIDRPTDMPINEVELNSTQSRQWSETRTKFVMECPGFTHILYSLMNPRREGTKAWFTKDVPVAATDGLHVLLNPDTYFKDYSLSERVFILAHEVCHAMLNHAVVLHRNRITGKVKFSNGDQLPYDEETMQIAADHVINAMLDESKIGKTPKDAMLDKARVPHTMSVIEAYRVIYKNKPPQPGGRSGFDIVLKPGTCDGEHPTVGEQKRNDTEWKTAVAAAIIVQKTQGKLSGSMSSMFEDILTPQVSWQDYIVGFFRRKLGGGGYDWRKPDRRFLSRNPPIFTPARSGHGADTVAIAIDTSGSIGDKELSVFFAEMRGVLEDVSPRRVLVLWCDAEVHRVDEITDTSDLYDLRTKGAPGRGGTSFVPVFNKLKHMGVTPDALVYLTDGFGDFPSEPDYPTLWGSIYSKPEHYPFGDTIMVPLT